VLENAPRGAPTEGLPSLQPANESRKRPFSSISGDSFPTPTPTTDRGQSWSAEHRQIRPYIPPDHPVPFTVNDMAPHPATPTRAAETHPMPPRAEPNIVDGSPDGLHQDPLHQIGQVREIEDPIFNWSVFQRFDCPVPPLSSKWQCFADPFSAIWRPSTLRFRFLRPLRLESSLSPPSVLLCCRMRSAMRS